MKAINLWPTKTERIEFDLYDDKIRKLFRLPVRSGEIKSVTWQHGRLTVVFEKVSSHKFTIK